MNAFVGAGQRWPLSKPVAAAARHRQWYWLTFGLVLFFSIPFVLTDLVSVERDVYYGIYIGSVFAFTGLWLR